jgi:Protein of unknown function (DUF3072)
MTGAQASYLETLAQEAHEPPLEHDLGKAEASKKINRLQAKTGRGRIPRRARKSARRRD